MTTFAMNMLPLKQKYSHNHSNYYTIDPTHCQILCFRCLVNFFRRSRAVSSVSMYDLAGLVAASGAYNLAQKVRDVWWQSVVHMILRRSEFSGVICTYQLTQNMA